MNIKQNHWYIPDKRWIQWIGVSIVGAIAIVTLIDHWLPYALLSHHNRAVEADPQIFDVYGISAQTITFETPTYSLAESEETIQINGWLIPNEMSDRTVIILHGLGATRQDMLEFGLPLQKVGYNLVLIDLRSHGESGGKFFTYGYHEWQDVVSLLDWLEQQAPKAVEDVTLIGVSAGGAIAIPATARDSRIDRLITLSTFAELGETINTQTPLLPDRWRRRAIAKAERLAKFEVDATIPRQTIQRVNVPVLIIHGDVDGYIPFENGQKLYEAAKQPKFFHRSVGADHADILSQNSTQLNQVILDFMGSTLGEESTP
ncbi:MAG: alpha/beta hydrolase [Symploca sp. SIO2B6]|nr:alpha/beta hydrolase [Symploca sp. SIO2B6]